MLARRTKQYLSNQQTHRILNAFTHLPEDVSRFEELAALTDHRRAHGKFKQGNPLEQLRLTFWKESVDQR